MPVFQYQAVDQGGRRMRGAMPADDEPQLEKKLNEAGLWLLDATQRASYAAGRTPRARLHRLKLRGRRGRRELIDFCTLMTFQVRVGVSLVNALEVACQDCKTPDFRDVLRDLQRQLEGGIQLHEAMAQYPRVFSTHFISSVRAGEETGKLPESFDDLRAYIEWLDDISAMVRQASLYPSIVVTVIFCFTIFLFTFIIPKFAALLDGLKVPQPLLTRVVFGVGDVAKATWWVWAILIPALLIGIPLGRRISHRFNLMMDGAKLHWPIFGQLNLMLALSRFAHNLADLYSSGLPILDALKICQQGLIGNAVVEQAVGEVEHNMKSGSTLSEAMHRQPVFSALLLRMVTMGETSGNLDRALNTVSDYYNKVIPRRISTVFSIVEPMLMLFLIGMVGCIALAIYLPIISLMGHIH